MQLVKDFVQSFFTQHQNQLERSYAGINQYILLESFRNISKRSENDLIDLNELMYFDEILKGTPLEYISCEKFFYRSPFYVNPDVLIPRNETEILVENAITFIEKKYHPNLKVAEVGVGSFALGLSILIDLKHPISFWGGDISSEALEVARTNLFRLQSKIHTQSKIKLALSDRLKETNEKFDLIVSNPPYIRETDKKTVHESVDSAEPHLALYLADDIYIEWFEEFFKEAATHLIEKGAFFMEGHEDTLIELSELAKQIFKTVEVLNDYTGRIRFLHCYK